MFRTNYSLVTAALLAVVAVSQAAHADDRKPRQAERTSQRSERRQRGATVHCTGNASARDCWVYGRDSRRHVRRCVQTNDGLMCF